MLNNLCCDTEIKEYKTISRFDFGTARMGNSPKVV
jgi:hypothetical protein